MSHIQCIKELLLHSNLQINKTTKFRGTALHLACEINNAELVRLLLDNGAMVSLNDCNDLSVFEKTQNDEILGMLAVAMGVEQLKKHSSEMPVSKVNEVTVFSSFSIHGRQVVLHLDPENRLLSRYSNMIAFNFKSNVQNTVKLSKR